MDDDQKEEALKLAEEGLSISKIAEQTGVSMKVLNRQRDQDAVFEEKFNRARQLGMEKLADDLIDIPDEYPDVQRARVKADNIRWLLSKRLSHVYGDKLDLNISQTVDIGAALKAARDRALLPAGDRAGMRSVEPVDIPTQIIERTTGKEPDAQENEEGTERDVLPDIFS